MTCHIHVVGAGVAGLAAAVRLAENAAARVTVWEATQRAGGRCWSFDDARLDRRIDNGNHLILSANRSVLEHARRIGAEARLEVLPTETLPFVNLSDGRRWSVRVPDGMLDALRRPSGLPGVGPGLLVDVTRLLLAGSDRTVADVVRGRGTAWREFWEPLTIAVVNAPPEQASARVLAAVLRQTVLRGGGACRPVVAPEGLGAALVDPAVAFLERRGIAIRYRRALTGVEMQGGRVSALIFAGSDEGVKLGKSDSVILAASPGPFAGALGVAAVPAPGCSILNAHFRVDPALAAQVPPLTGLVAGAAQWIFRRGDVLSVTVSAAEHSSLAGLDRDQTLDRLWADVAVAARDPCARPLARRLLRERAATPDQSPEGIARRPPMRPGPVNLRLAGDHVSGTLPATLEAAIASGVRAAEDLQDAPVRR